MDHRAALLLLLALAASPAAGFFRLGLLERQLGRLAQHIEDEIESSLPPWLQSPSRRRGVSPFSRRADAPRVQLQEGLEAISGSIGEAEDALTVHFNDAAKKQVALEPVEQESTPATSLRPPRPVLNNPFASFLNAFTSKGRLEVTDAKTGSWYKGPNVCIDQEEQDMGPSPQPTSRGLTASFMFNLGNFGSMEFTTCSEENDKYICTTKTSKRGIHKTVTLTHRCCFGFIRGPEGCMRVELRTLDETLSELGTSDFLALRSSSGVEGRLAARNVTLFAPTNEAMQEFTQDLEALAEEDMANEIEARTLNEIIRLDGTAHVDKAALVAAHMVDAIHFTNDLTDEQVLRSVDGKSVLRINTYDSVPVVSTVNCARLVTVDQHSTQGVVHTIDRVLKPVTQSLSDIVSSNPQFSILKKLLEKTNTLEELSTPGQLTLFAPTDAAFRTMEPEVLKNLMEGSSCLDSIVKHHILPNVICSAAVQGKATTINKLESYLKLVKDEDEALSVEGAAVSLADVMATNGVMHVVDRPLMPEEAKSVREVLQGQNLTRFLELVDAAGLGEELLSLNDVTVFAPSNKAFDEIPKNVLDDIMSNGARAQEIVRYHISNTSLKADDVENNHVLDTEAGHPLRINLFNRVPLLAGLVRGSSLGSAEHMRLTAGCAPVSVLDARACGAVVHVIEKLLVVPKDSVMDILEDNPDFSIFTQMIKDAGLSADLTSPGPITVLAPSDHVFRLLPPFELKMLMNSTELKRTLVFSHIVDEQVCCTGINANTWLFMNQHTTLNAEPIHIRRTNRGRLMAGPARITHCSSPTHNGLVHTVNRLMLDLHKRPEGDTRPLFSTPGLEMLFG